MFCLHVNQAYLLLSEKKGYAENVHTSVFVYDISKESDTLAMNWQSLLKNNVVIKFWKQVNIVNMYLS